MAAQPRTVWNSADVHKKVWTTPVLQQIDPTRELLELFRRIQTGEGANQTKAQSRRISAMRKQGADLS